MLMHNPKIEGTMSSNINFVPAQPSSFGKIVKVVLFSLLLISLATFGWHIAVRPWIERSSWERAGSPLPACHSPYVVKELVASYGTMYAFLSKFLPMDFVFQLRRVKLNDTHNGEAERLCHAQYTSLFGNGNIDYTVSWFDVNHKDFDNLSVKVIKTGMPEVIDNLLSNKKDTLGK